MSPTLQSENQEQRSSHFARGQEGSPCQQLDQDSRVTAYKLWA